MVIRLQNAAIVPQQIFQGHYAPIQYLRRNIPHCFLLLQSWLQIFKQNICQIRHNIDRSFRRSWSAWNNDVEKEPNWNWLVHMLGKKWFWRPDKQKLYRHIVLHRSIITIVPIICGTVGKRCQLGNRVDCFDESYIVRGNFYHTVAVVVITIIISSSSSSSRMRKRGKTGLRKSWGAGALQFTKLPGP